MAHSQLAIWPTGEMVPGADGGGEKVLGSFPLEPTPLDKGVPALARSLSEAGDYLLPVNFCGLEVLDVFTFITKGIIAHIQEFGGLTAIPPGLF